MDAATCWFGNRRWPSGASPGAWARDVFRIEGCASDRDKALAINAWLLRCMHRGPNLRVPSLGGYVHCADPLLLFTSWGHNECTGWGFVAVEALQANGVKARRAVAFNAGHTFYEVWYRGLDGVEGWHAFDPFLGWYFLDDRGEVASCEELAANPDLVAHPRPGGRHRLGHHPERSGFLNRYQVHDLLDVVQPVRGDELRYDLRPGHVYANLWRPEVPPLASRERAEDEGAHDDLSLYDEEGRPRYPEHHRYWKPYVWPTSVATHANGRQPVRWHGCGALRWQPLLGGAAAASSAANAVFERGTLRPSGTRRHCEVWWHVRVPYLISHLRLHTAWDTGGGDLIGIAISADGGRSLHPLHWAAQPPPPLLTVGPCDVPGVRNLREFWLRVDISSQSPQPRLRLRGLQITVGYQLNMQLLPRLLPGANELHLDASSAPSFPVACEWAYTDAQQEERVVDLALRRGESRCERTIDVAGARPDDLVMRGVTLRCGEADATR